MPCAADPTLWDALGCGHVPTSGVTVIRYLPVAVELALLVFCLIDCLQTPSGSVRNLAKGWWIVLIVLIPIAGPIAWLVAGRPRSAPRGSNVPWPSTATSGFPEYERPRPPRGPDDDPAFLTSLDGPDPEKEWLLEQWEQQLRDREATLRGGTEGVRPADPADGAGEAGRNGAGEADANGANGASGG